MNTRSPFLTFGRLSSLFVFLTAALVWIFAPLARAAATGAPGTPNLTQDNWDGGANYSIIMNMWWGNNGTTWQLFENGVLVHTATLTDNSPNAQTASFAFTNKPNGSYTYTNKLINSFGTTAGTTLVYTVTQGSSGPTVPPVPTGLAATANSTSQISVTWSASSGATGYDLQVDGTVVSNVTSPYAHTGLAAGSSHTYAVRAKNSAGTSAFSSSVTAFTQSTPTLPAVPTGLTATVNSSSQITVTWNTVSNATGYDLQVDGVTVSSVTSPYVHSGLAASSTHSYAVRAKNSVGSSAFSTTVTVKTQAAPTVPPVPTGLAAAANGSSQINVTWNASSGATGYDLQIDGTTVSSVTSPYAHTGLAASSTHTYAVRAKNSAGASAFSAAVSATTDKAVSTGPLPKHVLTGYWQNFNNGAKVLRISDVPTTYNLIVVAFADASTTPGAVTFNLDPSLGFSEAQFISDIATVKGRGQHVIISVGGQNGTVSVNSSSSASAFASSVNALIAKYGFEGVDIDLENGVNSTFMAQALRAVKSGSIITMAPQTIDMQNTADEYFKLALAIKDILTICNMQYYNSGSMLGYDGKVYSEGNVDFLTALATIQLENGLRPDQVGLGLPASTSGAGSGYVSPSVVNQALDILATGASGGTFRPPHTYPSIRGAMTWSINWDASNGYNFANSVSAKLKTLP